MPLLQENLFFYFSFYVQFSFLLLLLSVLLLLLFVVFCCCCCCFLPFFYCVLFRFSTIWFLLFLVKFMTSCRQFHSVTMPCVAFNLRMRFMFLLSIFLPPYFSSSTSPLFGYSFSELQLISPLYLRICEEKLQRPRKPETETEPESEPKHQNFYSIWRHKLPLTLSLSV